jgi:glycosyltransferase involved in cell wall biosynthesis
MNESDLHIGINLLPLIPESGGVETYVRSFVEGVKTSSVDPEFTAFINKESRRAFDFPDQFQVVETPVPASIRPLRYFWEQAILPYQIKKNNVDVLFSPGVMTPIFASVPSAITIHDANFAQVPETFSRFKRAVISRAYPLSAKNASKIITVSNFSKKDILEYIDIPANKIETVYNPLPPDLPTPEANAGSKFESDYLLTVGKDYSHKNLETAIQALSELPEKIHHVFVGFEAQPDHHLRLEAKSLGVDERVHFAGYVSKERLATLYSEAEIYVHPSRYEGFGFPLIEAMYYDTPVISSDVASLPEVGGDAAVYFDPNSPTELSRQIRKVYQSEQRRQEMIRKGKENINRFSCDTFVEKITDVCVSVVDNSRQNK